jgi:tripartite-type tricarboxylate transporter receptor subunit TctC
MRMKRLLAAASAILLCLMYASIAHAHYPDRPVRIVVPVAAGGGVDVMARLLAQALSEHWGQQFVIENRPGAAGIIGTRSVIASPPDGYTLLYTPSSLALAVVVNKSPPYDVARDLSPVINVAVSPYALALHRAVPAASVSELVPYARAHPNTLSYGSAGIGSASHLAAELFKSMAGIEMVHVPNKKGRKATVSMV